MQSNRNAMKTIYIAGPMRGFKHYNFPAFDDAKEELETKGWRVINPADLDRDRGFDPTTLPDDHDWNSVDGLTHFKLEDAITEDVKAIRESDAIFMLPGWRQSTGATAEYHLAKWAGKEIHEAVRQPESSPTRKDYPVTTGCLHYFPDALMAVARCSLIGNDQHNPGEPLHWARNKSDDHLDCLGRHLLEAGKMDDDGIRHDVKVAWRALANLQTVIDQGRGVFE